MAVCCAARSLGATLVFAWAPLWPLSRELIYISKTCSMETAARNLQQDCLYVIWSAAEQKPIFAVADAESKLEV